MCERTFDALASQESCKKAVSPASCRCICKRRSSWSRKRAVSHTVASLARLHRTLAIRKLHLCSLKSSADPLPSLQQVDDAKGDSQMFFASPRSHLLHRHSSREPMTARGVPHHQLATATTNLRRPMDPLQALLSWKVSRHLPLESCCLSALALSPC